MTRVNKYCWIPVSGTPFTLGMVVPEAYGLNAVKAKIDATSALNFDQYFREPNWKVHPTWLYCKLNPSHSKQYSDLYNQSPEEMVTTFLEKWKQSGENVIEWITLSTPKRKGSSQKLLFCKSR